MGRGLSMIVIGCRVQEQLWLMVEVCYAEEGRRGEEQERSVELLHEVSGRQCGFTVDALQELHR